MRDYLNKKTFFDRAISIVSIVALVISASWFTFGVRVDQTEAVVATSPETGYWSAYSPFSQNRAWTAGTVYAVAPSSDGKAYIGGDFDYIGPNTGGFGLVNAAGEYTSSTFPMVGNNISDEVHTVIPDGAGGWYVGGNFTKIGNNVTREGVAHILSDGTLGSLNLDFSGSVSVQSLVLSGGTLYIGGDFSSINGQTRNSIAAVTTATSAVTAWDPDANSSVSTMLLSGATLYVGGSFTSIGGQTRNYIAALDTTINTNNATAWDPNADSTIQSMLLSGTTLYAGGTFTTIGGQSRSRIAALDTTINTSNATTWNPGVTNSVSGPGVRAMQLDGTTLYITGGFIAAGGATRFYAAGLDTTIDTSNATSWNPQVIAKAYFFYSGIGRAIYVSGGTVAIGGGFHSIGGVVRNNIARIDTNGKPDSWNPNANNIVRSLQLDGTTLYAGGDFTTIGGQTRGKIAALDTTVDTSNATAWDPDTANGGAVNGNVNVVLKNGSTVYLGGAFTSVGATGRNRLAALDVTTGAVTAFDAALTGTSISDLVLNVAATELYIGGVFTAVGPDSRNNAAAVSTVTSSATAWNPNVTGGGVTSLVLDETNSKTYIGGSFSTVGGQARTSLARVASTGSGSLDPWQVSFDYASINDVALDNHTLYVGGNLQTGVQYDVVAVNTQLDSGNILSWDPQIGNPDGDTGSAILDLATRDKTLYAVGHSQDMYPSVALQNHSYLYFGHGLPSISSLSPNNTNEGSGNTVVSVGGLSFVPGSVVRWNGSDRVTSFVDDENITFTVLASDLVSDAVVPVTVFNPTPAGGLSSSVNFTINAVLPAGVGGGGSAPAVDNTDEELEIIIPALLSISPSKKTQGSASFTVIVIGALFDETSVVTFGDTDLVTTFISSGELKAEVPETVLNAVGEYEVSVASKDPDSEQVRRSEPQIFTVTAPEVLTLSLEGTVIPSEIPDFASIPLVIPAGTLGVSFDQVNWQEDKASAIAITGSASGGSGYTVMIRQDGDLRTDTGQTIRGFDGNTGSLATNVQPLPWVSPVGPGYFGYSTTNTSLAGGLADRFFAGGLRRWAALTALDAPIASHVGDGSDAIISFKDYLLLRLSLGQGQVAGTYQNNVIITIIPHAE